MKMTCDSYAPIYSMMSPLGYIEGSRVTVLAFNLKPVFTFYYSALFVRLMYMSNHSAWYPFLVASHGAIFKMSHSIGITAIKNERIGYHLHAA